MPRSLVLGNGNILVGLDEAARVKDFCFPYVGQEHHIDAANPHRIGVFTNNRLSWLGGNGWEVKTAYQKETMAGITQALNSQLGLRLEIQDVVYNEKNIFLRKLKVYNNRNQARQIKLFFNQEFQIYGTRWGNTAYFHPDSASLIHYKGQRVFLISGRVPNPSNSVKNNQAAFDEYSTGLSRYLNYRGTWKDAEDGRLSGNPIEHGSVDSTLSFKLDIKPRSYKVVYYWIAVGQDIEEVYNLNSYILDKTPQHLLKTTRDFWRAWVNKQSFNFYQLPKEAVAAFKTSLLVMRSQTDNRGGILASSDQDILQYGKDTYNYVWPRDAAYAAMAFDKAGYFDITQRFFHFCLKALRGEGYLMHKYFSDGSLGSSWHPWVLGDEPIIPIQQDETATVLFALWRHYKARRDLELIEHFYNPFIKKIADFLVSFNFTQYSLPQPSYDLWEEKFGIFTYTVASVIGALKAAAFFSRLLGKRSLAAKYRTAAEGYKKNLLKHLYLDKEQYFAKGLEFKKGKLALNKLPDISSVMGLSEFGVLTDQQKLLRTALENTLSKLTLPTQVGGIARYQGDSYYQIDADLPGNPWYITTLWYARHLIRQARSEKDLQKVHNYLNWAVKNALPSGLFTEQIDPHTGRPLSVSPLTWSHAFYVLTILEYLEKLSELGICEVCQPITLHFES